MGTGAGTGPPTGARRPEPSREGTSLSGIELWPIVVADGFLVLVICKKFGQQSSFAILLCRRRRDVDETHRLRQPAGTIEKALGLLGHVSLLQMVDQLRRRIAFGFSNGLQNAWLGDTAEIIVDGWSPPGLDHVEPDGVRQDIGLVKLSANAVRRDPALIGAVSRLIEGVDGNDAQWANRDA